MLLVELILCTFSWTISPKERFFEIKITLSPATPCLKAILTGLRWWMNSRFPICPGYPLRNTPHGAKYFTNRSKSGSGCLIVYRGWLPANPRRQLSFQIAADLWLLSYSSRGAEGRGMGIVIGRTKDDIIGMILEVCKDLHMQSLYCFIKRLAHNWLSWGILKPNDRKRTQACRIIN